MLFEDNKLKLRRVTKKVGNEWPIEKKIECVTKYLVLGNLTLVSELTGVKLATLTLWKRSNTWKELEVEIKASKRIQTDSKLSAIIDLSLDGIKDRIENGEHFFNQKTGDIERRPVQLRDLNTTANTLMQRQAILEKMNSDTNIEETQQTIKEQLEFLAGEFAKFNLGRKQSAQTIEYKEIEDDAYLQQMQDGEGDEFVSDPIHQ